MPILSEKKNTQALTLTFVAEFDASVDRVWQLWEDPRKLERWWGPPAWPATFTRHEFEVGGWADYHITGPDGEKPRGWWRYTAIESERRLEFDYGFSDDDGKPVEEAGSAHGMMTLEAVDTRTRMTLVTKFTDADRLQQMMEMGMQEGMREALGQIDAILAEVHA
jgi:uncharacterized protein YndB with AHSA1/START domain